MRSLMQVGVAMFLAFGFSGLIFVIWNEAPLTGGIIPYFADPYSPARMQNALLPSLVGFFLGVGLAHVVTRQRT